MTEQSSGSGKERRRYPRIFVQGADGFGSLVGATAIWPGGEKTEVLDLSYTGAAIAKVSGANLEKGSTVNLSFQFAGQTQAAAVEAKIIRADGKLAACQIESLSPQARLAFENFLNDNLLGLNLRPVSASHFSVGQDFDHWLHGPKDTNVFIWGKGDAVEKAIVEIDNQILVWNKGKLAQGRSRADLISAIEDYYSPVLYESVRAGTDIDRQLLSRVVKILSQAQDKLPPVKVLLTRLQEQLKT
ncbi:MAG: PilZ domain-containing protein [Bdellovibrionia bacterium]